MLPYVSIFEIPGIHDPTKILFKLTKNGKEMKGMDIRDQMRGDYRVDPEEPRTNSVLVSCHIGTTQ